MRKQTTPAARVVKASRITPRRSYRTRIRRSPLIQLMVRSTTHRTFPRPAPVGRVPPGDPGLDPGPPQQQPGGVLLQQRLDVFSTDDAAGGRAPPGAWRAGLGKSRISSGGSGGDRWRWPRPCGWPAAPPCGSPGACVWSRFSGDPRGWARCPHRLRTPAPLPRPRSPHRCRACRPGAVIGASRRGAGPRSGFLPRSEPAVGGPTRTPQLVRHVLPPVPVAITNQITRTATLWLTPWATARMGRPVARAEGGGR